MLQGVERYAAGQRTDDTVPRRWFPPIMAREDFLLTDYLRSFPDMVGSVDVFTGGDKEHKELLAALEEGRDWTLSLEPAEVVLSSSICHSLYGTLPTEIPVGGLLNECCGFAFRHEPSIDPARMQSFRMYEFVLVGTPGGGGRAPRPVAPAGARLARRARAARAQRRRQRPVLRAGRTDARRQPADRRAQVRGGHRPHRRQADRDLLRQLPRGPLRAAVRPADAGREVAHSACFGYGLERITLALFATHGMDVADWPGDVRSTLRIP